MACPLQRIRAMNAEMLKDYNNLVRLMREIVTRWPGHGIMMIMDAQRVVIREDSEAIARWAAVQGKIKAPGP